MEQTIWQKYAAILQSPRFHQILAVAVIQTLQYYGYIDSFLANTISTVLGVSVAIRTVDKVSDTPVILSSPIVKKEPTTIPVVDSIAEAQKIIDMY